MSLAMVVGPRVTRIEPWPYDLVVDGNGLMTGDLDRGVRSRDLHTEKADEMPNVSPVDFSYGARDPRLGAITPYLSLRRGYGQPVQESGQQDERYYYAINANCSCGEWQKGPNLTVVSPPTHDNKPVNRSFEMGGNFYWLNGRYAFRLDSAGNALLVNDFGAGKTATDVALFWSNGGTQTYAYIAMGDTDNAWRFDGAAWTVHPGTLKARAFCVIGRNIWRAHDRNKITLCNLDADPWTEANWANPNSYPVGDRTYVVNRLAVLPGGQMLVFKEDQPWIFDLEDLDRPAFPYFKFAPDPSGGEPFGTFVNDLYVSYGKGSYKVSPDLGLEPIGVDELTENDSPVRGKLTAFCGQQSWYMFAGLYNEDTSTAYLAQRGSVVEDREGGVTRIEAWHASLTPPLVGLRITHLTDTAVSAPAGHRKMVMGLSDGTLRTFVLSCVPNPAACDQYRWSIPDGEVYLPRWTAAFDAHIKALRDATIGGYYLSADAYAYLDYRTDPLNPTWLSLSGAFDVAPTETIEFPFGVTATIVDLRVRLRSSGPTVTPRVRGLGLGYQLHTDMRRIRTLPVLACDGLVDREGKSLSWGAARTIEILRAAHDAPAGISVTFPDETTAYYKVTGWRDVLAWDRRTEGWRAAVEVQFGEVFSRVRQVIRWDGQHDWDGQPRWG